MNINIGIALFTLMILSFSPCAYSAIEEDSIFTARDKVYPALVNIGVVGKGYQNGRLRRFPAAGSGVM